MKRSFGVVTSLALSFCAVDAARADIIRRTDFGLGADAELREQNGGTETRGTHWELATRYSASHNQHMMLRFDLTGISATDLIANSVSDLRLFVNRNSWSTGAGTFQYYALKPEAANQLWNESTVNFTNAPGVSYDGVMTTRGFTTDTTLVGELAFSGTKPAGTALDFSSAALTNVVLNTLNYYSTHGGTPVLTMLVGLKEGSPAGQNYIVKSKNADSTLGTGLLTGAQYNPQLVMRNVVNGNLQATWRGGSGLWSNPAGWSLGYPPQNAGSSTFDVEIAGASTDVVTLDTNVTIQQYAQRAGTVRTTGNRTLTVNDKLIWSGGTFEAAAGTNLLIEAKNGVVFTGNDYYGWRSLRNTTIENTGTCVVDSPLLIALQDNSSIYNRAGATFEIKAHSTFSAVSGGPGKIFNDGTWIANPTIAEAIINPQFTNRGIVEVAGGSLEFRGSVVSQNGQFIIGAGALLEFAGASTFDANSTIKGAGTLSLDGANIGLHGSIETSGDVVIKRYYSFSRDGLYVMPGATLKPGRIILSGGLLDFSTGEDRSIEHLTIEFGELSGSDNIIATTLLDCRSGAITGIGAVPPELHIDAGARFYGAGSSSFVNRRVINNSFINFEGGGGALLIKEDAILENPYGHTIDFQNGYAVRTDPGSSTAHGGLFLNSGTILVSSGTYSVIGGGQFENRGVVDVRSGILYVSGAVDFNFGSGGLFHVASGGTLDFNRFTIEPDGKVLGDGVLQFSGDNAHVYGEIDVGTTLFVGKNTILHPGAKLTNLGDEVLVANFATVTFNTGKTQRLKRLCLVGDLLGSDTIIVEDRLYGVSRRILNHLVVEGELFPGGYQSRYGSMIFNGAVELTETASLLIGLNLYGAGNSITSENLFTLGGELDLAWIGTLTPAEGTASWYTIIDSEFPLLGSFKNVPSGGRVTLDGAVGSFQIFYGPGSPWGEDKLVATNYQVPEPAFTAAGMLVGSLLLRPRRR